jgi:hypothetical protein
MGFPKEYIAAEHAYSEPSQKLAFYYHQGFIQKKNLEGKWVWQFNAPCPPPPPPPHHQLPELSGLGIFCAVLLKIIIATIGITDITCIAAPKNSICSPLPFSLPLFFFLCFFWGGGGGGGGAPPTPSTG